MIKILQVLCAFILTLKTAVKTMKTLLAPIFVCETRSISNTRQQNRNDRSTNRGYELTVRTRHRAFYTNFADGFDLFIVNFLLVYRSRTADN